MKVPISYGFIIPLILYLSNFIYLSSLFYPYIMVSGIIGILIILFIHLIIISTKLRKYFYKLFPHSITKFIKNRNIQILYFIIFIILKLYLMYIWPINISYESIFFSLFYMLLIYVI